VKVIRLYQRSREVRDRAFAIVARRAFAEFGTGAVLRLPFRMWGEERIALGPRVMIESNSWLLALDPGGRIVIGEGTQASGQLVVSAAGLVEIGADVLIARNVYISDHSHARDSDGPIRLQGTTPPKPVRIDDGAWLGQNVVVLPGVTIGRNAIVGANSVVRDDVPANGVAVGAPARIVG
jgi:acetyltransferase-like isoleucine patch superfamily enzyme